MARGWRSRFCRCFAAGGMPKLTQLQIDMVVGEAIQAGAGVETEFAEARCAIDFEKVHSKEIMARSQCLGGPQHRVEGSGREQTLACCYERTKPPIVQNPAVVTGAVEMDLDMGSATLAVWPCHPA